MIHEPVEQPLLLVVSVMEDRLILWSVSGLEGDLKNPKLVIQRGDSSASGYELQKLSTSLEEIVIRRWPKERSEETYKIIIQSDKDIPFHVIAEILSGLRQTKAGTRLFSDILLAKPIWD